MNAHILETTNAVDRRHQMWAYFLYLCAAILPGGVLLVLLRWIWLRLHM
jgi:hypothetical protein